MVPAVTPASSTMIRICATGSSRRGRGARDSGTNRWVSQMAASPTGTLTQKIARQPTVPTSTPPSTGPTAKLIPTTLAHTPIARARRAGSVNVLAMMDSATGLSIDPPTACSMRNATRAPSPGAMLHSSEPRVNSASPIWKTRRRPNRSASDPASISRLAITTV